LHGFLNALLNQPLTPALSPAYRRQVHGESSVLGVSRDDLIYQKYNKRSTTPIKREKSGSSLRTRIRFILRWIELARKLDRCNGKRKGFD